MPTYEYECSACKHCFEELQSIKADPLVKCPACSRDTLVRLISGGGNVIFKGDGWPSKENKIQTSDIYKTQKDTYEKSYNGVDVSHARAQIENAGRKKQK